MADSAAFFAKKKKTKKKFKSFNANKVDVSAVSSSVHVDAPAVSTSSGNATSVLSPVEDIKIGNTSLNPNSAINTADDDDEWASMPTLSTTSTKKNVVSLNTTGNITELLDMTALQERHAKQDDVTNRMKVEETKMALAKAREGMEKEAQRLKEEQEKKEEEARTKAEARAAGAPTTAFSSAGGSTGGKWVPSYRRNGGGNSTLGSSTMFPGAAKRLGSVSGLDTKDEEAFPDLMAAATAPAPPPAPKMKVAPAAKKLASMEQENVTTKKWIPPHLRSKEENKSFSSKAESTANETEKAKPTPSASLKIEKVDKKSELEATKSVSSSVSVDKKLASGPPSSAVAATSHVVPPKSAVNGVVKKKKKKKKDLSTFKASSS